MMRTTTTVATTVTATARQRLLLAAAGGTTAFDVASRSLTTPLVRSCTTSATRRAAFSTIRQPSFASLRQKERKNAITISTQSPFLLGRTSMNSSNSRPAARFFASAPLSEAAQMDDRQEEHHDEAAAAAISTRASAATAAAPPPTKRSSTGRRRTTLETKDPIVLTERAADRIKELLQNETNALGIRLGVRRRGCNGLSYTLNYVYDNDTKNNDDGDARSEDDKKNKKQKNDMAMEAHGVKIWIEPMALFSVVGTTMDWEETELASEFTFHNPNSKGECGCGESFNV